jgi:YHS domain-containing protein
MKKWLHISFPIIFFGLLVLIAVWSETTTDQDTRTHTSETASGAFTDPVCNMEIGHGISHRIENTDYYFCTDQCRELFVGDPDRYLSNVCIVCESEGTFTSIVGADEFSATWQGATYEFCSEPHRAAFAHDPSGYFLHTMWGIPNWLYYSSIAVILVLSFGVFEWRSDRQNSKLSAAPFNLMNVPGIRTLVQHSSTRFAMRLVFVLFFLTIIAAGLFGSQIPSNNIAPLLTWTIWWGGLILVILYAGSLWCYVCPWDAISDWIEGFRFWGVKKDGLGLGLKVPKALRNIWIAIGLFVLLTWLELGFGITMNPRATAWLALGIIGAAFISVFIFERKAFCRYACPVGRIIGIYSLFSPVEVRAEDPEVCRKCRTQSCYKGNEQGEACPTSLYIPAMKENTNCINCMECAKSCESDNVALNLRPWGNDLAVDHRVRMDEAVLALVLLTLAAFHGLTMTGLWRDGLESIQENSGLGYTAAFSFTMLVLIVVPIAIYSVLVNLSYKLGGTTTHSYKDYFVRYAYTLLPIALFYHLAHNSEHLLMEGQKIIALFSDPFGWGWNLFDTAGWSLAPLVSLKTLWLIQVLLVLVGHVYSLWAAKGVAHRMFGGHKAMKSQLPILATMVLFSLVSLWLLKQPMEMRSSAM